MESFSLDHYICITNNMSSNCLSGIFIAAYFIRRSGLYAIKINSKNRLFSEQEIYRFNHADPIHLAYHIKRLVYRPTTEPLSQHL